MSIMRMRKVFRSKLKVKAGKKHVELASPAEMVFYLIIVIFLVGAFYTFGGPGGAKDSGDSKTGTETPVVATINGEKIPRALFTANIQNATGRGLQDADLTMMRYIKTSTLNSLTESILLRQAAKKEKIRVSSADLDKEKDTLVEQTLNSRFPEKKRLRAYLLKEQTTLDQYKQKLRSDEFGDLDALREQVARRKLQELVESRVTLNEQQVRDSYNEIQASHILIDPKKVAESMKAATPGKQISDAEADAAAQKKAQELLTQLQGGADFAKLALANSADPGSATKGGDLGWFKRGMMVKEFEDAAFALKPGQLSGLVKSSFGYHIIKVIGQRSTLPADFEKNKAMYTSQVTQQLKGKAWNDYQQKQRKEANIQILDPELQAYQLLDEGKAAEGKAALEQAVTANPQNASALWELAALYETAGDSKKAVEYIEKVSLVEEGARSPMVHFKFGELLEKTGDRAKAIAQYKDTLDRASALTMMNMGVNMRLEEKFKNMGETALAAEVKKWLDEYRAQQGNNPMGGGMPMGGMPMGGGMPMPMPAPSQ